MPLIEITTLKGALSQIARDSLVSRVAECVLKWEGADADNKVAQALTWTFVHEVEPGTLYVGNRNPRLPRLRIEVTTPAGALDDQKRAGLVAELAEIIDGAADGKCAGNNHWVLFKEISDGYWGAGGHIWRRGDIFAVIGAARPS